MKIKALLIRHFSQLTCDSMQLLHSIKPLLTKLLVAININWKFLGFHSDFDDCSLEADPEGPGCCALLLSLLSLLLVITTMPFSLCLCIKVAIKINLDGRMIDREDAGGAGVRESGHLQARPTQTWRSKRARCNFIIIVFIIVYKLLWEGWMRMMIPTWRGL